MKKYKSIFILAAIMLILSTTAGMVYANVYTGLRSSASEQMGRQGGMMPGGMQGGMQGGMSGAQSIASEPGVIEQGATSNDASALEADLSSAQTVTVTESNSDVEIDSAGTYIITGSASSGNITVKKGTENVVLVLRDLDLTSATGAALSLNKESVVKVIIEGNVTLTDGENPSDEYSADAEIADAYDGAAIKVKAGAQAVFSGNGTLTVNGNAKNGVKGGDNASVIIDGPSIVLTAANDGINVSYDLAILSGSLTLNVNDDAIHADRILTIGSEDGSGPVINIPNCYEGLEATVINLYGGEVSIVSQDDAVNAANKDGTYASELTYSFNMLGGTLSITSVSDGIDSNQNVNLIGGTANIKSASNGGEAGIDYDGAYYLSDAFFLNNLSGVSGPDMMGGMQGGIQSGMSGGMQGGMPEGMGGGWFQDRSGRTW